LNRYQKPKAATNETKRQDWVPNKFAAPECWMLASKPDVLATANTNVIANEKKTNYN